MLFGGPKRFGAPRKADVLWLQLLYVVGWIGAGPAIAAHQHNEG